MMSSGVLRSCDYLWKQNIQLIRSSLLYLGAEVKIQRKLLQNFSVWVTTFSTSHFSCAILGYPDSSALVGIQNGYLATLLP